MGKTWQAKLSDASIIRIATVGCVQKLPGMFVRHLPDTASSGMEYYCQEGDGLWTMSDEDVRALVTKESAELTLPCEHQVVDAAKIRQPKAYSVYDGEYKNALDTIAEWIDGLENVQTIGRNGLHRYNDRNHSMLLAMFAARNILGEKNDVWNVNSERSYHQEFELPEKGKAAGKRACLGQAQQNPRITKTGCKVMQPQ